MDTVPNRRAGLGLCVAILTWNAFTARGAGLVAAEAATVTWTTGGPFGGTVVSLAIDPTTPTTLYAATPRLLFKSLDGGASWARTGAPSYRSSAAVVVNPSDPATLYIAGGGVYRSTDGGVTWEARSAGLTHSQVFALAMDPTSPDTLYAGTFDGVFKTVDGGGSWSLANQGLGTADAWALVIDPTSPSVVYAGTPQGVYRTTDGALTWAPSGSIGDIRSLAIDASDPARLFAAGRGGLWKSTDSGAHWTGVQTGIPLVYPYFRTVAVDPQQPGTVYAGTYSGGLLKSTDSGTTWATAGPGPGAGEIRVVTFAPATLLVGSETGVFTSADQGTTWQASSAGMTGHQVWALACDTHAAGVVYGGGLTFYRSTDAGANWRASEERTSQSIVELAVDPAVPGTVYVGYAGGTHGLWKSTDSGETWTPVTTLASWNAYAVAIDPVTPSTMYVGTFSGVFRSTDSGSSWVAASSGLTNPYVQALAIDPRQPTTLYAGTQGGIFKSSDAGSTWTLLSGPALPYPYIHAIAIDPVTPARLYAGTDFGVYRSEDAGLSWTSSSAGLNAQVNVQSIVVHPANPAVVYAGLSFQGVYRSIDFGRSWTAVNDGLSEPDVYSLALGGEGTVLYAGTAGGVWQLPLLPVLTVSDVAVPESNSGTVEARFEVRLSHPGTQAITVDYATADGTARAGQDYLGASGTLTFPAGSVGPQTISVGVIGDRSREPSETFSVLLAGAGGALVPRWFARGTIVDDDDVVDFDGDGKTDLLWHNQSSGHLYAWHLQGTVVAGGGYLTPARLSDTLWQARGLADFDGDGDTDVLWHHQGRGELYVWLMDGTVAAGGAYLTPRTFADTRWQIRIVADLDADGRLDLLWQNATTGELYVWKMAGLTVEGGSYLTPSRLTDTRWRLRGAADIDHDGQLDLLWHHQTTGDLYIWLMDHGTAVAGSYLTPRALAGGLWRVAVVADFDADGWPDLLWHHQATGELYVWFMNGTAVARGGHLTPEAIADTSWKLVPQ